jgi:glycosyltransferase involved in cell wall biosynthesis
MRALFSAVRSRRPETRFLFLTGAPDQATQMLEGEDGITIMRALADAMPRYLGAADVALALRAPSFSMQAVFPVKIGEYLLCGLPVVATRGVGDIDRLLSGGPAFFLDGFDSNSIERAASWIVETALVSGSSLSAQARRFGKERFGLDNTISQYAAALSRL